MSAVFRWDIEDTLGNTVTALKNVQYFSCELRVARRGSFRLQLHDDDPNRSLIQNDYILRYWMKDEEISLPWTNIFNGIIKTPSRTWYGNSNKLAIWYGSDSNELIAKSLVMYPTSSKSSDKSGIASDVMAELLDENIAANATIANGRFIDHVNPVTIVSPSPGVGPVYTGNLAHDNLMKALQGVREFTHDQDDRVDFQAYYVGNYQWEIHVGKIYEDKTINGLDPATGLNSAGNTPVILSPLYGNVKQYTESTARVQESNVVLGLGKRVGADREFAIATDAISVAVSAIAQRESLAQTQNQDNLTDFVQIELQNRVGKQSLLVEPKFNAAFSLFRDLNIGDFFTVVSLDKVAINKQLIELKTVVQQTGGGRTISRYTLFTDTLEPNNATGGGPPPS